MKLLYIYLCLYTFFAYHACTSGKATSAGALENSQVEIKDTLRFGAHVQPILEKRCSPCHFTGGKMYERMPFDKDTTLIHHQASILRRIKDTDENAVIKGFLLQEKK